MKYIILGVAIAMPLIVILYIVGSHLGTRYRTKQDALAREQSHRATVAHRLWWLRRRLRIEL